MLVVDYGYDVIKDSQRCLLHMREASVTRIEKPTTIVGIFFFVSGAGDLQGIRWCKNISEGFESQERSYIYQSPYPGVSSF